MAKANEDTIVKECIEFIQTNMANKLFGYKYEIAYDDKAGQFEIVFAKGKPAPITLFQSSADENAKELGIFNTVATLGTILVNPRPQNGEPVVVENDVPLVEEFEIHLSAETLHEFITGKSSGALPQTELELALGNLFGHFRFKTSTRNEHGIKSIVATPRNADDAAGMFTKLHDLCGRKYTLGLHRRGNFAEVEIDTGNAEELTSVVSSRQRLGR